MKCPNCNTEFDEGVFCPECGTRVDAINATAESATDVALSASEIVQENSNTDTINVSIPQYTETSVSYDPSWPKRNKLVAALLAIFLGGIGIHKFYLGKIVWGIVYLLFAWTFIPELVGFIEGIVYLCMSDERFQEKYHVRLR